MLSVWSLALFVALFPSVAGYAALGGYMPVSGVSEHSEISLDIAEFGDKLKGENPDYSGAKAVYTGGANSCKSATNPRTLQGFAVKNLDGEDFYDAFNDAGFPSPALWNGWIINALDNTGVFAGLSNVKRVTALKKGILGLVTLYASHELESGIKKGATVATRLDSKSGHAWDEGWAFYYGADAAGKNSPWEVSKKRDENFPAGDQVHTTILPHFNKGLIALRTDTYDDAKAKEARDSIYKMWSITYIRAALKYLEIAETTYQEKAHAEGYAYYRAIDGWVASKNAVAAKAMRDALEITKTSIATGTYCDAKQKMEAAYSALGIDCDKMGTYTGSTITCTYTTACPAVVSLGTVTGVTAVAAVAGAAVAVDCRPSTAGAAPTSAGTTAAPTSAGTTAGAAPTSAGTTAAPTSAGSTAAPTSASTPPLGAASGAGACFSSWLGFSVPLIFFTFMV